MGVLLFGQGTIYAQESSVSGYVYDAQTNASIPFVNIIKKGTLNGTHTNNEGYFKFNLNGGVHELEFTNLSYRDTLIRIDLEAGTDLNLDVYLYEDELFLDEIIVSADRVTKYVQQLARKREEQKKGLKSYSASLYKLAILSREESPKKDSTENKAFAFSERVSSIDHILKPERYSESLQANRASKNFFSEYDFFSTGGPPLNLNLDLVPLSILSEDLTVVGPISKYAGRYYYLEEYEAGEEWPEGTKRLTVSPKYDNRPLFIGEIWVDELEGNILGIDVRLNEYASTNSGLFSISDLRYQQKYKEVGGFWLPSTTILSATLSFISSSAPIKYVDEWTWSDHKVNPKELDRDELSLSTQQIRLNSHKRKKAYWDSVSTRSVANTNRQYLEEATKYNEKNRNLKVGMSMMSKFFRLPYQLERLYFTNISDFYHFNRVDGHTIGFGFRTPVHSNYDLRFIFNRGLSSQKNYFQLSSLTYLPKSNLAAEFNVYNSNYHQYQDYDYNRTPLDFFEFRHTINALLYGNYVNNYFNRKGYTAGLRLRFDIESFARLQFVNEDHLTLSTNTTASIFGRENADMMLRANNDLQFPALSGRHTGLHFKFHHDTRKYLRTQFLRDYNVRDFGWLLDVDVERSLSGWGSDFDFTRYRIALKFNLPIFSSHFIQTDMIVGASDNGTPGQRMFNFNGFVVDDYVRERPFNTLSYKEPIGNRVSLIKVKYKFGTSLTRKAPIKFIQKSGIHLATFITAGTIDQEASLSPLIPDPKAKPQAEIGLAAFKIFGFIYVEFSKRLIGDYGNRVGLQVLF